MFDIISPHSSESIKEHYLFIVWCAIWCWWWLGWELFGLVSSASCQPRGSQGYVCGCYQFLDAPDWKNDIGYITQRESGSRQSVSPQSFISKLLMNSTMLQTLNVYALYTLLCICIDFHCSNLKGISKSIKNVFWSHSSDTNTKVAWELCCGCVSCLGCNLIKMCEECNLSPSDLFYSLAANMAGAECDPAISTGTQSRGCCWAPASDWSGVTIPGLWLAGEAPHWSQYQGSVYTRERQQCAALYDQATSQATSTRGKYQRFPPLTFQGVKRIVLRIGREMETKTFCL